MVKLRLEYPSARTTSGFVNLINSNNIHEILNFRGEKPNRIVAVALYLKEKGIETEEELGKWLEDDRNLNKLRKLKGIGSKTIDYFKILVGIDTNAVDRHLENFLKNANIIASGYDEHQQIIIHAADTLHIKRSVLDYSIWNYMSEKRGNNNEFNRISTVRS